MTKHKTYKFMVEVEVAEEGTLTKREIKQDVQDAISNFFLSEPELAIEVKNVTASLVRKLEKEFS